MPQTPYWAVLIQPFSSLADESPPRPSSLPRQTKTRSKQSTSSCFRVGDEALARPQVEVCMEFQRQAISTSYSRSTSLCWGRLDPFASRHSLLSTTRRSHGPAMLHDTRQSPFSILDWVKESVHWAPETAWLQHFARKNFHRGWAVARSARFF